MFPLKRQRGGKLVSLLQTPRGQQAPAVPAEASRNSDKV